METFNDGAKKYKVSWSEKSSRVDRDSREVAKTTSTSKVTRKKKLALFYGDFIYCQWFMAFLVAVNYTKWYCKIYLC